MNIVPASFGARVGAYLIDWLIPIVLLSPSYIARGVVASQFASGDFTGAVDASQAASALTVIGYLAIVVYTIAQFVVEGKRGMTLGKRIVGLRTVRADTLGPIGFGRALGRIAFVALGGVVIIGGYVILLSPLWDAEKRNRGWHDKVANTWVLDVKNGVNPLPDETGATARVASETALQAEPVQVPSVSPQPPQPQSPIVAVGFPVVAGPPVVPAAPSVVAPDTATESVPASTAFAPITGVPGVRSTIAPPAVEDDEKTRMSVATSAAAILRMDTGEEIVVTHRTLLGRDPSNQDGVPGVALVSVPDQSHTMSKTHAEVGLENLTFWVSDRNSTNGTRVRRLGGIQERVAPGERVFCSSGDVVVLGDRTFELRFQQ